MPFPGRHYGPELLTLMGSAIDSASQEAHGLPRVGPTLDAKMTRNAMAFLIMQAVDEGLCEPEHLKRVAMLAADNRIVPILQRRHARAGSERA